MRVTMVAVAVVLSCVQVAIALAMMMMYSRDFQSLSALRPAAVAAALRQVSWESEVDMTLITVTASVIMLCTALSCRFGALFCYSRLRRRPLRWASFSFFAACNCYALVKLLVFPRGDDFFWGAAVLLFVASTVDGFVTDGVLVRTYTYAVDAMKSAAGGIAIGDKEQQEEEQETDEEAAKARAAAKKGRATLGRLLALSIPDLNYVILGFSALCIAAVAGTLTPGLTGKIIDAVADKDVPVFKYNLMLLLAAAAAQAVFTGARGWAFTMAIARLKVRLRDKLLRAILRQPQSFFDRQSTGELSSRLSSDTTSVGDQISLNVNVFLRSVISAVGSLIFMLSLSWRLTLLSACTVPPTIVIGMRYGKWVQELSRRSQKRLADCSRVCEEALSNIATVRSFAGENAEADRHAAMLAAYYEQNALQADSYALYAAVTTFLPSAVTGAVLWAGGDLISAGSLSSGTLVSFLLYQLTLAGAFASISDIYSGLQSAVGAAEKIFSLLDREPEMDTSGVLQPVFQHSTISTADSATAGATAVVTIVDGDDEERQARDADRDSTSGTAVVIRGSVNSCTALRLMRQVRPPFYGRIDLEGVTFAYPTRPEVTVLQNFNLTLRPGEVVALVGTSGGGKSSICKLVQRLYSPLKGRVLLDGVDIGAYDHRWLHNTIATVSQEPVLFARSIWSNIAYSLDVESEESTGGSRALVTWPPSGLPAFKHLQAGQKRNADGSAVQEQKPGCLRRIFCCGRRRRSTAGGSGRLGEGSSEEEEASGDTDETDVLGLSTREAYETELAAVDNVNIIIQRSKVYAKLQKEYASLENKARHALRIERRLRMAERARAAGGSGSGGSSGGSSGRHADGGDGYVPLLADAAGGAGKGGEKTAEAALVARYPNSEWEAGYVGTARSQYTGGKRRGVGRGDALKGCEREVRRIRRERRVREWIRQQRAGTGSGSAAEATDSEAEAVYREWYGTGTQPDEEEDAADEEEEAEDEEAAAAAMDLPAITPTVPVMRRIIAAGKLANAHDFITKLPDAYNTEISERGVSLSGGQKQRVAIARACLRDPRILILDESTAALDAESEHVVQQALNGLMRGRTVLVIAHRLSTIRDADRICVVSGGGIVEEGSHERLMAAGGAYAKLVSRQLASGATTLEPVAASVPGTSE